MRRHEREDLVFIKRYRFAWSEIRSADDYLFIGFVFYRNITRKNIYQTVGDVADVSGARSYTRRPLRKTYPRNYLR